MKGGKTKPFQMETLSFKWKPEVGVIMKGGKTKPFQMETRSRRDYEGRKDETVSNGNLK